MTLVFYSLAILQFILTRFIGGRWYWGYFLGGVVFGIYNEISFEFCWDYSAELGLTIWRDIPLIVVLGWGIFTTLALTLSNRLVKRLHIKNIWLRRLFDVSLFALLGMIHEVIVSGLGYWNYNASLHSLLWVQIFGYVFVGIIVSGLGRGFQAMLDRK